MKTNKRKFLTSETLAELDVPCLCSLSSDTMTSLLITSDSCINTPKVKNVIDDSNKMMTQCRSVIYDSNTRMTQCRSVIYDINTRMTQCRSVII